MVLAAASAKLTSRAILYAQRTRFKSLFAQSLAFPFFETKFRQANAFEGMTLGLEYERRTDVD